MSGVREAKQGERKHLNWVKVLLNDYGMVVVLILLMVVLSLVTIDKQEATGASAGAEIKSQLGAVQESKTLLVIASGSNLDDEFCRGVRESLEDSEHEIIAVIQGKPRDANLAMKKLKNENRSFDAIVCTRACAKWDPVRDSGAELFVPRSFYWPDFLMPDNLVAIAQRITIIAIIAIGMTMIIVSGGIDLSVGSLIALSSVVTGIMIRDVFAGSDSAVWMLWIASIAGVLSCGIAGFGTGFLVAAFRLPPFIVTLAMMLIARGIANVLSEQRTIHQIPASFETLGKGSTLGLPVSVILMFSLYLMAHFVMSRTVFGRQIYAVGGNEEAARLSGVRVKRVQLAVYTICGLLAGLGGVILTSQLRSAKANFGQMDELSVIAAVVVGGASLMGGQGKVFNTLIGAFIIGMIQNAMNIAHLDDKTQMIVLGSVIILAVLFDKIKKGQVSFVEVKGVFTR